MKLKSFISAEFANLLDNLQDSQTEYGKVVAEFEEAEKKYKLHARRRVLVDDYISQNQRYIKKMIDASSESERVKIKMDFGKKHNTILAELDKIESLLTGVAQPEIVESRKSVTTQIEKLATMVDVLKNMGSEKPVEQVVPELTIQKS